MGLTKERRKEKYDFGKYAGWANWATWHLWLCVTNEEFAYRKLREMERFDPMEIWSIYKSIPYTKGTWDMKKFINWDEIEEAWKEIKEED